MTRLIFNWAVSSWNDGLKITDCVRPITKSFDLSSCFWKFQDQHDWWAVSNSRQHSILKIFFISLFNLVKSKSFIAHGWKKIMGNWKSDKCFWTLCHFSTSSFRFRKGNASFDGKTFLFVLQTEWMREFWRNNNFSNSFILKRSCLWSLKHLVVS